jgi:hypothetical protein
MSGMEKLFGHKNMYFMHWFLCFIHPLHRLRTPHRVSNIFEADGEE